MNEDNQKKNTDNFEDMDAFLSVVHKNYEDREREMKKREQKKSDNLREDAFFKAVHQNYDTFKSEKDPILREDAFIKTVNSHRKEVQTTDRMDKEKAPTSNQETEIKRNEKDNSPNSRENQNGHKEKFSSEKKISAASNLKNNSIGKNKITKKSNKKRYTKKEVNPVKLKYKARLVILISVLTLTVSMPTVSKEIIQPIYQQIEASNYTDEHLKNLTEEAIYKLISNNLAAFDKETKEIIFNNNTAEDYEILKINDKEEVYVYHQLLPEEEFNKFITTVGNDYGIIYPDFDYYLIINGYVRDEKIFGGKKPDFNKFEKDIKEELSNNFVEINSLKGRK